MGRPRKVVETDTTTSEEKGRPGQKRLTEAECEAAFEAAMKAVGAENLHLNYDEKGRCSVIRLKDNKAQTVLSATSSQTFARMCKGAELFAKMVNEQ